MSSSLSAFSDALAEVEPELRTHDIAYECRRLEGLSAAQALQEVAQAENSSLLVVGTGRRPALGSTAQRLLHGAPCPVAAVPHEWRRRALRTIGVAIADPDSDQEVLAAAHAFAVRAQGRLRVITVVHMTPAMYAYTEASTPVHPAREVADLEGESRALAERTVRRAVAGLGDAVPIDVDAFVGDPGEMLVELSERVDLLVCGSRGYGPLRAVLLGSVSRRLVAEAHCPVLVLPRGVSAPLDVLLTSDRAVA